VPLKRIVDSIDHEETYTSYFCVDHQKIFFSDERTKFIYFLKKLTKKNGNY